MPLTIFRIFLLTGVFVFWGAGIYDFLYSRKFPERTGKFEEFHPVIKRRGDFGYLVSDDLISMEKPGAKHWREMAVYCFAYGLFILFIFLVTLARID